MNFLCFIACLIIPESPDYLYSKGNYIEARANLIKIGRINNRFNKNHSKVNIDCNWKFDKEIEIKQEKNILEQESDLKLLIQDKKHLKNLMIFISMWIVGSFAYFMILFQMKYV